MIITNSIISIVSATIVGLLIIMVVPLYLNYLDYESYALIGISFVINSFSQVIDFGFHRVLMRRTSLFYSGNYDILDLRRLLKSVETVLFLFLSIPLLILALYSEWIFSNFFNVEYLNPSKMRISIVLMFLLLLVKAFYGIYRGGIEGFERFKWIGYASVLFNILRYPGGLILLIYKPDINKFFAFQLIISLVELFVFRSKYLAMFNNNQEIKSYFSWKYLIGEANFSKSLTYLSIISVLFVHLDKFILMNSLTMKEFGFFTTILIFSTGMLSAAVPFGNVVVSRLTFLHLDTDLKKIKNIYGDMTQLAVLFFLPISITVAIYSWEFIFLLTGSYEVANWGQVVLSLFIIGNFFFILGGFQYYLQLSHGNLRMHTKYVTILFIMYAPVLYYLTYAYGAAGAGLSWLLFRIFSFFFWTPIVHKKYLPGMHWDWLKENVFYIILGGMLVAIFFIYQYPEAHEISKSSILLTIIIAWFSIFLSSCLFSSLVRRALFSRYLNG